MRPLLLMVLLVALGLAPGCAKQFPSPPTESTAGFPNFLGDWSTLAGDFQLVRTTTQVEAWNATQSAWKPLRPQCDTFLTYDFDEAHATLYMDRNYALHPADPGPLSALWLNDEAFGPRCHVYGFFGINEDTMNRTIPLLSPGTGQPAYLSLNVTFTRDAANPPNHRVMVHNVTLDQGDNETLVWEGRNPFQPDVPYRARSVVEFFGAYPYASVRRV